MRDVRAVSGHTVGRAVEDGRVARVIGVFVPRPVWLVAGVTALIAEGLFVGPSEITVPRQEAALDV